MKVEALIDTFEGTIPVRVYHPNGDIDKYEDSIQKEATLWRPEESE